MHMLISEDWEWMGRETGGHEWMDVRQVISFLELIKCLKGDFYGSLASFASGGNERRKEPEEMKGCIRMQYESERNYWFSGHSISTRRQRPAGSN